jgi:Uma2 family endonuclease
VAATRRHDGECDDAAARAELHPRRPRVDARRRAPLLAIEVLSPSTRHIDLGLKLARYETAGCPSYRVFDPDEPALTVWDLAEGRYVERAHVAGGTRTP